MDLVNPIANVPGLPMAGTRQGRSTSRAGNAATSVTSTAAQRLLSASQTFKDVGNWLSTFEKRPNLRTLKAKEISASINSFHTFSQQYIEKLSALADSASLSWLEFTLDNVLLDYWEPILRAAEQNRAAHYRPLFERGYAKLDALQKDLETRLKLEFKANVVLFFERVGKARRYPFGNTYLIGIPLIDAYRDDWMALPHELGHHLFWKARFSEMDNTLVAPHGTNFLEDEINSTMQQLDLAQDTPARATIQRILNNWTEEIFADVVGARIAGREFVQGAWDRISRTVEDPKGLFQSDGEHPIMYLIPALRAAAAEVEVEDKWKDLFGEIEYAELAPNPSVDKPLQDPAIKIADLSSAVQLFARNITARLREISIDRLIEEPSSLAELKGFETILSRELEKRNPSPGDETARLRALLTPFILERGEGWNCRSTPSHANPSSADFCQTCGIAKNIWSYLPF